MRNLQRSILFFLLFAAVGVAGLLEFKGGVTKPDADLVDTSGLTEDADLILKLYPDSPEADYIRGVNAKFLRFNLEEARQHFERALATGIKAHEDLLYDYAIVLFLLQADSTEVDAAFAAWRENAPGSSKPDQREFSLRFPEWMQAGSLCPMALSPNAELFAMIQDDGGVAVLDLANSERRDMPIPPSDGIEHLFGFSRNGGLLAVGNSDGLVLVVDVQQLRVKARLAGHPAGVLCADFSPDGVTCATGCQDHLIRLWDIETANGVATLSGHSRPVSSLTYSGDGKWLASGCWDGSVRLWRTEQSAVDPVELDGHEGVIADLSFSPDGELLASGARDGCVRIWDVDTAEQRHILRRHSIPVSAVTFSPDGQFLATGAADSSVSLWNTSSGNQIVLTPAILQDGVSSLAFAVDEAKLVAADFRGSLQMLRMPDYSLQDQVELQAHQQDQ